MLRFGNAITFPPNLKSNLSVSFNINTCDIDDLLLSELINVVSTFIKI